MSSVATTMIAIHILVQCKILQVKIVNILSLFVFKVLERMQENVYVTIDGTKHARLIYYYMLLEQCEDKDNSLRVCC